MIMSFAQPLGIGVTSDGEYLDIELKEPVASDEAVKRLNQVMVEGMDVVSFTEIPEDKKSGGMTIVAAAAYEITMLASGKSMYETVPVSVEWKDSLKVFLNETTLNVMKKTKRSEKEVNIRPMIYRMEADEDKFSLFLAAGSEEEPETRPGDGNVYKVYGAGTGGISFSYPQDRSLCQNAGGRLLPAGSGGAKGSASEIVANTRSSVRIAFSEL